MGLQDWLWDLIKQAIEIIRRYQIKVQQRSCTNNLQEKVKRKKKWSLSKEKETELKVWNFIKSFKNPPSKNYDYHTEIKKEDTGNQTLFFILFHFSHNNSIKSETEIEQKTNINCGEYKNKIYKKKQRIHRE